MKKIFFPLALFVSVTASAQKISGKLSFQKGQKLEVVNNINSSTEMMMGESKNSSVSTDVYEVKDISDAGITMEKSTKHIKLNLSIMGQEKTIDSDNPQDLKGMAGEPIKEMLQTRQEFTIDGYGKIVSSKAAEKRDPSNPMMNMVMQQTNMAPMIIKEGNPSIFKILPSYEVGKGDTWTDSLTDATGTGKISFTIKDITDTEILLDYVSNGTVDTKQEMMGMSAAVKGTTEASGTITLHKSTGLLKQKTATTISKSAISFSGQDMQTTSKVTSVTTVKTL
jgi:hypothetical protein